MASLEKLSRLRDVACQGRDIASILRTLRNAASEWSMKTEGTLCELIACRYRQKFFVMEKEKKQEELQKRLDEIDEENLRAERERRKKQEEEYDSLYGAELERKKKLQASSMASMLDELDSLGGGEPSVPSEPLDPDAAMFALTPGARTIATRLIE